jgi:hypothetical protein
MRHGPWRLYKFFYDGEGQTHRYELYNLEEDIGETRNLADELTDRVKEMSELMVAHIEEAEILLPNKNEDYAGNVAAGWLGSGDTRISAGGKILSIQSAGNDPWVETVYTPNISNATFVMEFEMKSNSSGPGGVSWIYREGRERKAGGPVSLDVIHDGDWHKYQADMALEGILSDVRIIPSAGPGEIQLRNIRLVTQDGYYIRDWPLY